MSDFGGITLNRAMSRTLDDTLGPGGSLSTQVVVRDEPARGRGLRMPAPSAVPAKAHGR